METDTGMLTTLLNMFLSALSGGYDRIAGEAQYLLYHLIIIEIVVAVGFKLLWEASVGYFLWRIIVIGFVVWLTNSFDDISHQVIQSFFELGLMTSNADIVPLDMRDPSRLITVAFTLTQPIAEYLGDISLWDSLFNVLDVSLMGLSMIGIIAAFVVIALQCFVLYLEMALILTFGVLFVPFGALMPTSFLFDRVILTIISFGVRFTMLTAIIAIGSTVIQSFSLPPEPTWQAGINMLAASAALALLAWHGPSMASGLLGGAPALSAASIASAAIAGGEAAKAVSLSTKGDMATAKSMSSVMAAASAASVHAVRSRFQK